VIVIIVIKNFRIGIQKGERRKSTETRMCDERAVRGGPNQGGKGEEREKRRTAIRLKHLCGRRQKASGAGTRAIVSRVASRGQSASDRFSLARGPAATGRKRSPRPLRFASPRLASPRFASPSPLPIGSRQHLAYTEVHTATYTYACIHARNRNANVRTHVTTRIERSASRKRRLYSPPRYLAASTPRPSHRPYLHPPELAESAAIFYFREHILHCDVERSRQVARRRPTRFGRLRRESVGARRRWWDEASCVVGIADEERRPTPRERARWCYQEGSGLRSVLRNLFASRCREFIWSCGAINRTERRNDEVTRDLWY